MGSDLPKIAPLEAGTGVTGRQRAHKEQQKRPIWISDGARAGGLGKDRSAQAFLPGKEFGLILRNKEAPKALGRVT